LQDGTYNLDDLLDFHEFLDLKEALNAHDRATQQGANPNGF
jgi:hypothetical protein